MLTQQPIEAIASDQTRPLRRQAANGQHSIAKVGRFQEQLPGSHGLLHLAGILQQISVQCQRLHACRRRETGVGCLLQPRCQLFPVRAARRFASGLQQDFVHLAQSPIALPGIGRASQRLLQRGQGALDKPRVPFRQTQAIER